jgi:hypothetical protein
MTCFAEVLVEQPRPLLLGSEGAGAGVVHQVGQRQQVVWPRRTLEELQGRVISHRHQRVCVVSKK